MNQTTDIRQLFAAIDDISAQARQTRLALEHQIDRRKSEIKQLCIQAGIDTIQAFIHQQSQDFQQLDLTEYINHQRFEMVIKSKGSIKSIRLCIDDLCQNIKKDISQRAIEVTRNGGILDSLPSQHKLLCQDCSYLLSLHTQELRLTIEKRIAVLNEEDAKRKSQNVVHELQKLQKIQEVELNAEIVYQKEKVEIAEQQKYRLSIDILSSKDTAIEIARSIREIYRNNSTIVNIRLSHNYD